MDTAAVVYVSVSGIRGEYGSMGMTGYDGDVSFLAPVCQELLHPRPALWISFVVKGVLEAHKFQWLPEVADEESAQPPEAVVEEVGLMTV